MNSLGRHLLVEFYGGSTAVLNDVLLIETIMLKAAQESGATILTSQFHRFPPLGVSGFIVLQESHFAIHTWPEYGYAALDLFTCGFSVNPWIAYKILKEAFQAHHGSALELNRGQLHLLKTTEVDFHPSLNNQVMCSEKAQQAYHEMLVHVPLLTHTADNILVIGGGDGGSVREIFRHPQVEQVILVHINEVATKAAKTHLSTLSVALDHPKLQLVIGDGIDYVAATASETYDLILIDSSDPVGYSATLFTPTFYQQIHRILKTGGVMVTQSGSPQLNQPKFAELYRDLYRIFGVAQVHCYLAFIATYPTGMWSFAYCSKAGPHPLRDFNPQVAQQLVQDQPLAYYNLEIHQAAFCLPTFVSDMLRVDTAAIFVES
jgi:spermidine synthase